MNALYIFGFIGTSVGTTLRVSLFTRQGSVDQRELMVALDDAAPAYHLREVIKYLGSVRAVNVVTNDASALAELFVKLGDQYTFTLIAEVR